MNVKSQIGRYELMELLGSGGMAEVYRARLSGPGRASKPVAFKLIRPQLAKDGQFVLMFLDELRIALALSHRNIVQTFDGGEDEGHYYLVMELVQGPSLAGLLKALGADVPVPTDLALFIATEICAALDHAHNFVPDDPQQPTGVLHRDVSPGNILLSDQGDVKLTDFGVAKATGRMVVTSTDLVKGKLSYMSPEQARGTVTAVSDLFSLGAVLYEMLARQPFRRQATLEEARSGRLQVPPLRKLRPEISLTLEAVVMRCLAADPSQRPPSARHLLQLLSEEAKRVPVDQAYSLDPRLRLQAFLTQGARPAIHPDRQERAQRLARAMISQAEDVPEDSVFRRGHEITLSDQHGRSGAPASSSTRITGTEPTAPQSFMWEDTSTHESPSRAFQEQQDSEGLPDTDIIAAELSDEKPRRAWGGLIAGIVGVPLLVALLFLWQDSAPVEDHSLPPTTPATSQGAKPGSQGEGTQGRGEGLAAKKEWDRGRTPVDAELHPSVANQVAALETIVPAQAPRLPHIDTQETTPRTEVRARRRDRRRQLLPPGTLNLNTDPWAKVYVDGKFRGETPLQGLQLSPGRHKVYLHNPQRELSARVTVLIHSGKALLQVVKLQPE